MSRCFPYPPPGFEKNERTDQPDLLAKEKRKEKKHKEKRDKEYKEGKEGKDKQRSKDKHKDKKDRKEKHKDKKRDKHKDKNKNRTSDARGIAESTDGHNEKKASVSIPKSEEVAYARFTKELGRRIRDEQEGAAKRMFENISGQIQGAQGLGDVSVQGMERGNNNTMVKFLDKELWKVDVHAGAAKRKADNVNSQIQGVQGLDVASVREMERGNGISGDTMVAKFLGKEQRRVNGVGIAPATANALQKERGNGNPTVASSFSKEQRKDDGIGILGHSVEKVKHNHQVLPRLPAEKDAIKNVTGNRKAKGTETDDGKGDGQRDRDQEEKKNKTKDKTKDREKEEEKKKTDDGKGNRNSDKDHEKKSQGNSKSRDRENEKEEKQRGIGEKNHKLHDRLKQSGEVVQSDRLDCKPLVVPLYNNECFGANDVHSKKRKHCETNGFLHEDAVRHNKAPKVAFSSRQPLENGMKLQLDYSPSPCPLMRHVGTTNVTEEEVTNNKEHNINGVVQPQLDPVDQKPHAADTSGKSLVVPKPPHPDTKYLGQVYSVPKISGWPESDDQEWLFSSSDPQPKPKAETKAGDPLLVWAKGLRIESADVFALPYVIPY